MKIEIRHLLQENRTTVRENEPLASTLIMISPPPKVPTSVANECRLMQCLCLMRSIYDVLCHAHHQVKQVAFEIFITATTSSIVTAAGFCWLHLSAIHTGCLIFITAVHGEES